MSEFRTGNKAKSHPYPPTRFRGSAAPLGFRYGYDQPLEDQTLAVTSAATIPRTVALAPLQVQIPNVTPGNTLEVDFEGTFLTANSGTESLISIIAFVNFGLAPAPFGPNLGWQRIILSSALGVVPVSTGTIRSVEIRSFSAVTIPDGAVNATVVIVYATDADNILIKGVNDADPDVGSVTMMLKATELSSIAVVQESPAILEPFTV